MFTAGYSIHTVPTSHHNQTPFDISLPLATTASHVAVCACARHHLFPRCVRYSLAMSSTDPMQVDFSVIIKPSTQNQGFTRWRCLSVCLFVRLCVCHLKCMILLMAAGAYSVGHSSSTDLYGINSIYQLFASSCQCQCQSSIYLAHHHGSL